MALARASLAYTAWSTEKGLSTSSALASIFLWVKPCCSTWMGIPSSYTAARRTWNIDSGSRLGCNWNSLSLTFDTQCISLLPLMQAYPRLSASNLMFPKWSTLAIMLNKFCIIIPGGSEVGETPWISIVQDVFSLVKLRFSPPRRSRWTQWRRGLYVAFSSRSCHWWSWLWHSHPEECNHNRAARHLSCTLNGGLVWFFFSYCLFVCFLPTDLHKISVKLAVPL